MKEIIAALLLLVVLVGAASLSKLNARLEQLQKLASKPEQARMLK